MNNLVIYAVVVFVCLFLLLWFFYLRYWHIGNGMVLELRKSDGTVWVCSRLLNSPSGRSAVQNRSRVLSVDGIPMRFLSHEDFLLWVKAHKPKLGREEVWVFQDNFIAYLKPELIMTKIPVYWGPNHSPEVSIKVMSQYDSSISTGFYFCKKTGQYVMTARVSDEKLKRALPS